MAIFFPPVPPVPTGGSQPYGQKKLTPVLIAVQVDNPPFTYGGPFSIKAAIVSITQPNPWVYTFFGRGQPFEPSKVNPSISAVQVDNPPFTYGGPIVSKAVVASLTQPTTWPYVYFGAMQPYDYKRTNPSITDVRVDNPPFGMRRLSIQFELVAINQPSIWPYTFMGWKGPYMGVTVPPSVESAASYFRAYIIN